MFDYARNLQLALGDRLRSTGLMAGAGVVLLVGAGFLLAALWVWLADHLHWGALGASLAIGLGLVVIGLVMLAVARRGRHPMPTTDDLRTEVETRLNLAADAAIGKASDAADAALHRAQDKVSGLMGLARNCAHAKADQFAYRADRFADSAGARARQAAADLGVTEKTAERVRNSNTAVIAPLIGAFAVGLTLASRLRRRRDPQDGAGPEDKG